MDLDADVFAHQHHLLHVAALEPVVHCHPAAARSALHRLHHAPCPMSADTVKHDTACRICGKQRRQAVSLSQEAAAAFASQPQGLQQKHQGKPCSTAAHLQIPHVQLEGVGLGRASAGAGTLRRLHLAEDVFLHGQ